MGWLSKMTLLHVSEADHVTMSRAIQQHLHPFLP